MIVPASAEAFVLNAHVGGLLLFEGIESEMAQEGKVLSAVIFADAAVIFSKGDIQDPVEGVFNLPMGEFAKLRPSRA